MNQIFTVEKTFTNDEVIQFGEISGDQGVHHVEPDEHGRLMVQGLLTATLATKIGGEMNYIARKMTNEFIRPVYTGDTITCEVTIVDISEEEKFQRIELISSFKNQKNKEVLIGNSYGIIRKSE